VPESTPVQSEHLYSLAVPDQSKFVLPILRSLRRSPSELPLLWHLKTVDAPRLGQKLPFTSK
jgi:hypothetical protein